MDIIKDPKSETFVLRTWYIRILIRSRISKKVQYDPMKLASSQITSLIWLQKSYATSWNLNFNKTCYFWTTGWQWYDLIHTCPGTTTVFKGLLKHHRKFITLWAKFKLQVHLNSCDLRTRLIFQSKRPVCSIFPLSIYLQTVHFLP